MMSADQQADMADLERVPEARPRTDMFVRVHYGDLSFCSYCLRFLERNWLEEDSIIHVLANRDCEPVTRTWGFSSRVKYHYFDPWPDHNQFAGFLVLTADGYSNASYLSFIDADSMLLHALRATDLLSEDGKPVIWYRHYQQSGPDTVMMPRRMWAPIMERWLGVRPDRDFMQRFPFTFRASTLWKLRQLIQKKTGISLETALYSDTPYSPQTFVSHPYKMCEFNVLSFFAYLHEPERYVFRDIETVHDWPVKQYWSWGWDVPIRDELDRLLAAAYPWRIPRRLANGWMVLGDDVRDGHSSLVAQAGRMDVDVGGLRTHEFIDPYLKEGTSAIDGGAHIGTHTVSMMRALGTGGHVYSFEPHPEIYPALEHNIAKEMLDNPLGAKAIPYQLALGTTAHKAQLFCNPTNFASNTVLDNVFDCKLPLEIEVVTLDEIIPQEEEICFIKLDVEGGEYKVLQGAEKLLARWHPVIFMEFSENFLPLAGITEQELYAWFRERGYSRFVPFPEDWVRAGHHAHDLLVLPCHEH